MQRLDAGDLLSFFPFNAFHFVGHLQAQEVAGCNAVELAQAKVIFRGTASPALFHLREMRGRNASRFRHLRLSNLAFFQRFTESFGEVILKREKLDLFGFLHGFNGSR